MDTSIWIAHLHAPDAHLADLLEDEQVLLHPFVRGEVAMGANGDREGLLNAMRRLPQAVVVDNDAVVTFVRTNRLHERSIGFVDAHLLVATRITPGATLWTSDKRLAKIAAEFARAHII